MVAINNAFTTGPVTALNLSCYPGSTPAKLDGLGCKGVIF